MEIPGARDGDRSRGHVHEADLGGGAPVRSDRLNLDTGQLDGVTERRGPEHHCRPPGRARAVGAVALLAAASGLEALEASLAGLDAPAKRVGDGRTGPIAPHRQGQLLTLFEGRAGAFNDQPWPRGEDALTTPF